jgi:hypothetical protein
MPIRTFYSATLTAVGNANDAAVVAYYKPEAQANGIH